MKSLTPTEMIDLNRLSSVVTAGLGPFDMVQQALGEIDDRRLWREGWKTLDHFTRSTWGFRLISRMAWTRIKGEMDAAALEAIKDLPAAAREKLLRQAQQGHG